ncbi:ComF family protein [Lagierella sp.]|uniref:ComF family protein n=1 Tax=Lagierella sp. TaxID=2849657 RepID=UPI00261FED25|nr:ComF family protein [Lagierella sp.]
MEFKLLDLLFQPDNICLCCKQEETRDYICKSCAETLETIEDFKVIGDSTCYSPYLYSGHIKRMISEFKFREKRYYGKVFAKLLEDFYRKNGLDYDLLVPIPLHRKKLLKRGYNQCDILCDFLGERLNIPVNKEILIKIKETKDQHLLSSSKRRTNVNYAFKAIGKKGLLNKRILLVDDLITFGYTLEEGVRALKDVGYREIDCLVIGKARPESPLKKGR